MANLDIAKLLQNDLLNVRVTLAGKTIRAFSAGDFGFSLGNTWTSLVDVSSIPFSDVIGGAANVGLALTGGSQMSLQSIWMTTAAWNGSDVPEFSIRLFVPTYSRQSDPFQTMLFFAEGALPKSSYHAKDATSNDKTSEMLDNIESKVQQGVTDLADLVTATVTDTDLDAAQEQQADGYTYKTEIGKYVGNMFDNMFLEAPLGYGVTASGNRVFEPKTNTTYTLAVGKWFSASKLVITRISEISFSKECVVSGVPLAMYMTVNFKPYQLPTLSEFKEYFKKTNYTPISKDEPIDSPATTPQTSTTDSQDSPNKAASGESSAVASTTVDDFKEIYEERIA